MKKEKVLFVDWWADDVLGGTQNMDAMTELAYRRIIDLIYSTNDNLLDNSAMQYSTKTGSKWKKIREELINVYGKITIENGYIRNRKCTEKIEKARKNIVQKSMAGRASADKRKSLKQKKTGSTAVETAAMTDEPTNHKPIPSKKKDTNVSKKKITLDELSVSHIEKWLTEKRTQGKYLTIDEFELLEMFKDYCRSKNPRYRDYVAAFRNSFKWTNAPTKGTQHGKPTKQQRLNAALDQAESEIIAGYASENIAIAPPDPAKL